MLRLNLFQNWIFFVAIIIFVVFSIREILYCQIVVLHFPIAWFEVVFFLFKNCIFKLVIKLAIILTNFKGSVFSESFHSVGFGKLQIPIIQTRCHIEGHRVDTIGLPTAMTSWPRTYHLTLKWNVVATIITIIFISEFTKFFVVIFFWITAYIIIITFILGYTRGFVDVSWTGCWRSITRSMWEYNLFLMIHALFSYILIFKQFLSLFEIKLPT